MIQTIPLSLIEPGLYGLGCACNKSGMPLGAVSDYQVVIIGGKQYSAGELYAKAPVLIASKATNVYSSAYDNSEVKYVTAAGQTLGKYSSYLLPGPNRKDAWIELNVGGSNPYRYVKDENVSNSGFKDAGVQTVAQQVADEADKKELEADPISYYFKKLGVPVLLSAAGIYVAVQLGKAFIVSKVAKKVSA